MLRRLFVPSSTSHSDAHCARTIALNYETLSRLVDGLIERHARVKETMTMAYAHRVRIVNRSTSGNSFPSLRLAVGVVAVVVTDAHFRVRAFAVSTAQSWAVLQRFAFVFLLCCVFVALLCAAWSSHLIAGAGVSVAVRLV